MLIASADRDSTAIGAFFVRQGFILTAACQVLPGAGRPVDDEAGALLAFLASQVTSQSPLNGRWPGLTRATDRGKKGCEDARKSSWSRPLGVWRAAGAILLRGSLPGVQPSRGPRERRAECQLIMR